jgi:hypothetical protein
MRRAGRATIIGLRDRYCCRGADVIHAAAKSAILPLSGPGLEGSSGEWWTNVEDGLLLEFRMPIGDEPGYKDVLMRLRKRAPMSAEAWERFKQGDRRSDAVVAVADAAARR